MSSNIDTEEKKTYTGRCHCNATIFEVTIPPLETGATKVMQCNCSICVKKGYWLVYPLSEEVKFLKGEEQLKNYRFATKTRDHRFCADCGTSILIDFKDVQHAKVKGKLGVSIRTFDDIEDLLAEGKIQFIEGDGKHTIGGRYEPLANM